jgi:lipopolysaccharide export system protein LptC
MSLDTMPASELAARRRTPTIVGRGYSRFVSLTKWVLPTIALGLLLLVGAWPRIQAALESVHFSLPRIDLSEARDLRMVSARYSGIDKQNRPFVVTADVARQTPNTDDLISLEGPKADMTTQNGTWLEVTAYTGVYQPQSQLLDLFGDVQLYQDKGNEFHSDSARVDMAAGSAEGQEPVRGHGPFGRIIADGFRILNRGETIFFTGHATLELQPHEKGAE